MSTRRDTANDDVSTVRRSGANMYVGMRVVVSGLVSKPEFNGCKARVGAFDVATGRHHVALEDGTVLALTLTPTLALALTHPSPSVALTLTLTPTRPSL